MAPLLHSIGTLAPQLAAMTGKIPVSAIAILALVALRYAVKLMAPLVLVLPGLVMGLALGWWMVAGPGWHPLVAIGAGLGVAAMIFRILGHFVLVRLAVAAIAAPLAVFAVWHMAVGTLDVLWAMVITAMGAVTVGSLTRRLIESDNREFYAWANTLVDDLRGD